MSVDKSRVIVEDALCACCAVHTMRVRHREFPEIRAECGTVAEGVAHLIGQLKCSRENVIRKWQQELIDHAVADATAYLDALAQTERTMEAARRRAAQGPGEIVPTLSDRPAPP